jgi:quercetin dioxygenase-like cupin family protein
MVARTMIQFAAGCVLIVAQAAVTGAGAEEQPITRTELMRADVAGTPGKEAVIYIADLKPGAVGGKHTHFGDEFVYVLDGTLVVEPAGREAVTLKAGDVGHFTADVVHAARNGSADAPGKVLVVLVIDKGKPLAEPVK